jgi:hypothetical protein
MSRKFAATIITEVEFMDGDDTNQFDQSYLDVLTAGLKEAASSVSMRSIKEEVRVTYCAAAVMRPPSGA